MALRPINNSPYMSFDVDPYQLGGLNTMAGFDANTMTPVSIPTTGAASYLPGDTPLMNPQADDQTPSQPLGNTEIGGTVTIGPGGSRIAGQHTPQRANRI